jgi:type IV pilus assembly protein PilE
MGTFQRRSAAVSRACRQRGFTMLELMMVVVVVALLAAIALPSYTDYIMRSRITEATSGLSDARQRAEQWFLDNRDYTNACSNAIAAVNPQIKTFVLSCPGGKQSSTAYLIQADGQGPMSGFQYTVNEANAKITVAVPSGWTKPSVNCWAVKKDGSC